MFKMLACTNSFIIVTSKCFGALVSHRITFYFWFVRKILINTTISSFAKIYKKYVRKTVVSELWGTITCGIFDWLLNTLLKHLKMRLGWTFYDGVLHIFYCVECEFLFDQYANQKHLAIHSKMFCLCFCMRCLVWTSGLTNMQVKYYFLCNILKYKRFSL